MGAVKLLDKEITQYLSQLSMQQKEMDRRFAEMESGKVKGYTLEEMEAGARQAYKKRKRKK